MHELETPTACPNATETALAELVQIVATLHERVKALETHITTLGQKS